MKKNYLLKSAAFFAGLILIGFSACRKPDKIQPNNDKAASPDGNALRLMTLAASHSFKVMSFNIRHNDANDPQSLTQRRDNIRQIIVDNSPDVFGLQEASDAAFRDWFIAQMQPLGYTYTSMGAVASPKIIFYKSARFTAQSQGLFQLGAGMTGYSGTWVVLTDANTSDKYVFCNSHWYPGSSATAQQNRLINAQAVADKINEVNGTTKYPVIVFGDFNAEPGTAEVNLLKQNLDLIDALGDTTGDPTFHGWDATGDAKIDWMMSNRKMGFTSWKVVTTNYGGYWPSDHWPVMATYVPAIFGEPNTDIHGTSESEATHFYFADVNGDNKADKIYWNTGVDGGTPKVWLSNGDGTYIYVAAHTAGQSASDNTHYYYADVNGDGKADEIVWNPAEYSGHTRVFLATSGGSFSSTAIENNENGSATASTIYVFADVNGDGKADKIRWTSGFDGGNTRVNLATSGGNFNPATVSDPVGAIQLSGTEMYSADMNADGKADKIVWNRTVNSGIPMVYLSDGDGTFAYSSTLSTTGAGGTAATTRFYFADLDGDNRAEKIYWNPENFLGKVKVYYAQANNTFSGPVYSLRGTSESINTFFYFEDVNGDGKKDQIRWNRTLSQGKLSNYFSN